MNMERLVVLGNGFDLTCKLKTGYSEFFDNNYKDINIEDFRNNLHELKKLIICRNKYIIDMEKNIKEVEEYKKHNKKTDYSSDEYVKDATGWTIDYKKEITKINKEIESGIQKLTSVKDFNYWDYVFLTHSKDKLWCNVEEQIEKTLGNVNIGTIRHETISLKQVLLTQITVNTNFDEFLLVLSLIYLTNYEGESYKDFLQKNNCGNIYEFLLLELNKFEKKFKAYVEDLLFKNPGYMTRAHQLFEEIAPKEGGEIYVLNFNYTQPFKDISKRKIKTMNNIHGSLESDDIIFGIDEHKNDKEQLNIFTKTNRIMMLNKESKAIPNSQNVESITFFGHSLSEADYSYFLSLFDYYSIYNSDIKLIFYYKNYCQSAKSNLLKNIRKLMIKYGKILGNDMKAKNLMHKLNLENRIILREVNFKKSK